MCNFLQALLKIKYTKTLKFVRLASCAPWLVVYWVTWTSRTRTWTCPSNDASPCDRAWLYSSWTSCHRSHKCTPPLCSVCSYDPELPNKIYVANTNNFLKDMAKSNLLKSIFVKTLLYYNVMRTIVKKHYQHEETNPEFVWLVSLEATNFTLLHVEKSPSFDLVLSIQVR